MIELKQIDNSTERLIITGMIVSDKFLRDIQTIFKLDYLETPFARTVAGWCLSYWKKYKKAPGVHIQDIFNFHTRNGMQEDMTSLINTFLSSISNEYERADHFNVEYLLSQAENKFKERSLKILSEDIQNYILNSQVKEAEKCLSEYKRVERPQTRGINPFTDRKAIYEALADREGDILFTLPGDLGRFLGPVERSTFTGILGPEKRGKSIWLMHIATCALQSAKCNVAYFIIGDMAQKDVVRRMSIHNTMSSDKHAGEEIGVPILDCIHNQTNDCIKKERTCSFGVLRRKGGPESEVFIKANFKEVPDYVSCTKCQGTKEFKGAVWHKEEKVRPLTWKKAWEVGKRIMSRVGGKNFKMFTCPGGTINVAGICSQLDYLEESEQFVPDVIIIDYADNLAPEDSKQDERSRHHYRWMALRALSMQRYCAVFTATQSDADSYNKKSLGETNFSEDKRKNAHVTGFWALNQTSEEKKQGIMRIGKMFIREDDFVITENCTVLQCLKLGRPYLDSFL